MKIGLKLYALMLHKLKEPMTVRELAPIVGIAVRGLRMILVEMHGLHLVRIHDWKRVGKHGVWDRVFIAGEGADKATPLTTMGKVSKVRPPPKRRPRPALIAFSAMWQALATPTSMRELREEAGLSEMTVWRFVTYARRVGAIGVAQWGHMGQTRVAYYQVGARSKPKPQRISHTEIARRCRARKRERLVVGGLQQVAHAWLDAA